MNNQQIEILKTVGNGVVVTLIGQLNIVGYWLIVNPPTYLSWWPTILSIGVSCALFFIALIGVNFVRRVYWVYVFYTTIFFINPLLNLYAAWLFATTSSGLWEWVILVSGLFAAILGSIMVYRSTRRNFQSAMFYNMASGKIDLKKGTFDLVITLHLKNPQVEKREEDSKWSIWRRWLPFLPALGASINRSLGHSDVFLFISAVSFVIVCTSLNTVIERYVAIADEIRRMEREIRKPLLIPDDGEKAPECD